MDRGRSLVGYSPWHHKELDRTEQLTFSPSRWLLGRASQWDPGLDLGQELEGRQRHPCPRMSAAPNVKAGTGSEREILSPDPLSQSLGGSGTPNFNLSLGNSHTAAAGKAAGRKEFLMYRPGQTTPVQVAHSYEPVSLTFMMTSAQILERQVALKTQDLTSPHRDPDFCPGCLAVWGMTPFLPGSDRNSCSC